MKRKLFAFALGFVLLFVVAEAAMRITARIPSLSGGMAFGVTAEATAQAGKELFKIVVIGESTSQSFSLKGLDESWSAALAQKLNKHFSDSGIPKFAVVKNLAQAGSATPFQVDALEQIVRRDPPDLVISMMGVNDLLAIQVKRSLWYTHSYVGRFIYWSWAAYQCPSCYRLEVTPEEDGLIANPDPQLAAMLEKLSSAPLNEAEDFEKWRISYEELRSTRKEYVKELDLIWANFIVQRTRETHFYLDKNRRFRAEVHAEALRYFKNAWPLLKTRKAYIKQVCFIYQFTDGFDECATLIREALANGVKLTGDLFYLLVTYDPQNVSAKYHGYFVKPGAPVMQTTIASYRRVLKLSREAGFTWLSMQYPGGSVEGLKTIFTATPLRNFEEMYLYNGPPVQVGPEAKNIQFVGHEDFNELIKNGNEAEYFDDLFARGRGLNFGHLSPRGHSHLAETVFQSIVKKDLWRDAN